MVGKPTYEALEQRVKSLEMGIAERDREKEALRKAREEQLRQLGDNLPNGMIYRLVHDSKGGRSFVYASTGCERLFQVTPESIKKDASLIYNMFSSEDRQRAAVLEMQSIETLSPLPRRTTNRSWQPRAVPWRP
ncbi:MAG: hypothetical protein BBJ60_07980 [Desulfobacterales bacterium S7086C20]|nr:MAG: hypothetical protein BBJ60_07980 [Desulfobacterales bacterium S7086C20]